MEKKLLTYNRNSARLLHGIPRRWIIDQLAKTFHYCTSFIRNIGANLLTFGQCSNARGIFKRDLHEGVTNERASPCGAEKPGSPSLRNQIACLIQKYIHSSGTSSMKSSPQLKTDYPAFENKHALQPIVPSIEPSSQVASDGICARCIKTIDSILYMKGPAKKTIKKKKKQFTRL